MHDFKVKKEVNNINLFKLIREYISKEIKVLDKQLDYYNRLSEEEKYHIETDKEFNKLVAEYPISQEELFDMSKVLCEYVLRTRNTDIKKYFFINDEMVRLPFMLNGLCYDQINMIISDLLGEMNIDEKGNNVLIGGTEEYENKWKYEIGENYGLQKAIRIIKKYWKENT